VVLAVATLLYVVHCVCILVLGDPLCTFNKQMQDRRPYRGFGELQLLRQVRAYHVFLSHSTAHSTITSPSSKGLCLSASAPGPYSFKPQYFCISSEEVFSYTMIDITAPLQQYICNIAALTQE
jgi:hypothetical protein